MYEMSFFKVLAENSQLELPEKQKVGFTLGKAEEKLILIDLKYLMEKQAITFYSTSTIGNCSITANVYSSKQQTCPVQGEQSDFTITWGEHELPLDSIKSILKQKDMS